MLFRSGWVLLALLALAAPAAAQDDAEGAKDHPAIPRMPGYYINNYEAHDFDGYEFTVGDASIRVEGRFWDIQYALKDGAKPASALAISRNYRNAFAAKGGRQRYITEDAWETVLTMTINGVETWMEVHVSNSGEMYDLRIVEKGGMQQDVALDASAIAKALADTGAVALRNILFDTGRATLRPESAAALQPVIDVLKADPALRLEIQGHTDDTGTKAANLTLSQQRADAVRQHLVTTGGIAAARLTAVGLGDTKPVAPNTTEDGRAQNRRVELHKRPQ